MVEHSAVNRGVVGSSPTRGVFWLRGQAVKTSPFHGGNTSSILVGVTKILQDYNSKRFLARVRLANASLFARCGAQGALNLVGVTRILQDYNSKRFLARVRLANALLFARCGAQGALNLVGVTGNLKISFTFTLFVLI